MKGVLYFILIMDSFSLNTGKLATHDIEEAILSPTHETGAVPVVERGDVIQEEEETAAMKPPSIPVQEFAKKYIWRIDLAKTEKHWEGWFKGLSASFLNISSPKMLLLAGVDRLDRDLTVGQMQGKLLSKFLMTFLYTEIKL